MRFELHSISCWMSIIETILSNWCCR